MAPRLHALMEDAHYQDTSSLLTVEHDVPAGLIAIIPMTKLMHSLPEPGKATRFSNA